MINVHITKASSRLVIASQNRLIILLRHFVLRMAYNVYKATSVQTDKITFVSNGQPHLIILKN